LPGTERLPRNDTKKDRKKGVREVRTHPPNTFFRNGSSPIWGRQTLPSRWMGWAGVLYYYRKMIRVYLADSQTDERSAIRVMLSDLKMEVVGEAVDWNALITQTVPICLDMVLLEWDLLPTDTEAALVHLHRICPQAIIVALISHLRPEGADMLPAGADAYISKDDSTPHVVGHLLEAAALVRRIH
jgi:CheY-like chemotaxis protein